MNIPTLEERMAMRERAKQEKENKRIIDTYKRWAREDKKKYGVVTLMTAWKAQKLLNIDCDYIPGMDDGCEMERR